MSRAALGTASLVAAVVLLLALKPHHAAVPTAAPAAPRADAGTTSGAGAGGTGGTGASTSGTFTGDAVSTRYGAVQVAVTLDQGKITGVTVLQSPTADRRDREISSRALPRLTQEAISAQNAEIDAVSGATYTSEGYIQSLQSALDQAGG
ncbi:FMN-binding protein [Yinghuangia seranimata]|uniref:FMN-binding protein n=1 Tax=Yinghuangia seranimata TaxID=408067 RepID=UPI00248BE51E|nr:FMN-binding protein [Yinghuangia seranimata]MDI2124823.1 FMN-binding protein [Yinghuangia seranimata]